MNKFVVLWLHTFTDAPDEPGELNISTEASIEDALRQYNKLITNDAIQQVSILSQIKHFKRGA